MWGSGPSRTASPPSVTSSADPASQTAPADPPPLTRLRRSGRGGPFSRRRNGAAGPPVRAPTVGPAARQGSGARQGGDRDGKAGRLGVHLARRGDRGSRRLGGVGERRLDLPLPRAGRPAVQVRGADGQRRAAPRPGHLCRVRRQLAGDGGGRRRVRRPHEPDAQGRRLDHPHRSHLAEHHDRGR